MKSSEEGRSGLRVLLVEDDRDVAGVLQAGLQMRGYEVSCVATADEALTVQDYDVLVTDDQLTGSMNGLELIEAVDTRGTGRPAILISGNPDLERDRRASRLGVAACLQKPFHLDDLVQAIAATPASPPEAPVERFSREYATEGNPCEQAARDLGAFFMKRGLGPAHRSRIISAAAQILRDVPHVGAEEPVRVDATLHGRQVTVEVRFDGDSRPPVELDELRPALPLRDGGQEAPAGKKSLRRAHALAEGLEVLSESGRTVVRLVFELMPVGFDEDDLDLSNVDYIDPRSIDRLIEVLRSGAGDQMHMVPSSMAATVGRLLALSETNRTADASMWS